MGEHCFTKLFGNVWKSSPPAFKSGNKIMAFLLLIFVNFSNEIFLDC